MPLEGALLLCSLRLRRVQFLPATTVHQVLLNPFISPGITTSWKWQAFSALISVGWGGISFYLSLISLTQEFQNTVGKPLCVSRLSHSWTYCSSRPLPRSFWTHLSIDTFPLRFPTQLSPGPFPVQIEVETRITHTIFNCRYQVLVAQLCPTLCDPVDCSLPGSSVHRILQARILDWVAIPFCRDLPHPRIEPRSAALQTDSLPSEPPGKSCRYQRVI